MPLNMDKLNLIAQEWDPSPFLQAIDSAPQMPMPDPQPGGAMDMGAGADFASIMGNLAPGGPQQGPQQTPGAMPFNPALLQTMAPEQQQMQPAPAVMPQAPTGQMQFPGMPKMGKVPTLRDILGGV